MRVLWCSNQLINDLTMMKNKIKIVSISLCVKVKQNKNNFKNFFLRFACNRIDE